MLAPPAGRQGPLERRDARSKIIALLVFLVVVSTSRHAFPALAAALGALLAVVCAWARVSLPLALRRAAVVLPFAACFAVASWMAGDLARGLVLAGKSYLSCMAAWLVIATTPLPALLRALESFGAPRFLLIVAQFVFRYLFVISEEARQMGQAAVIRSGSAAGAFRRLRFRAAAGALAVLFARSYQRAGQIHQAMLARGFAGRIRSLDAPRFAAADAAFLALASVAPVVARLAAERLG